MPPPQAVHPEVAVVLRGRHAADVVAAELLGPASSRAAANGSVTYTVPGGVTGSIRRRAADVRAGERTRPQHGLLEREHGPDVRAEPQREMGAAAEASQVDRRHRLLQVERAVGGRDGVGRGRRRARRPRCSGARSHPRSVRAPSRRRRGRAAATNGTCSSASFEKPLTSAKSIARTTRPRDPRCTAGRGRIRRHGFRGGITRDGSAAWRARSRRRTRSRPRRGRAAVPDGELADVRVQVARAQQGEAHRQLACRSGTGRRRARTRCPWRTSTLKAALQAALEALDPARPGRGDGALDERVAANGQHDVQLALRARAAPRPT